jgi:N,N-dimethylformamidase
VKIVGYCDPLTVAAGERISFMVSTGAEHYSASVIRLTGRGRAAESVDCSSAGVYRGREQPLVQGSCAVVVRAAAARKLDAFTIRAWIWPTTPEKPDQGIVTLSDGASGYGLFLDGRRGIALRVGDEQVAADVALRERLWYFVAASFDSATGRACVSQRARKPWPIGDTSATVERQLEATVGEVDAPLVIGAYDAPQRGHFNGKIEAPAIVDGEERVVAAWDFGRDPRSDIVTDVSRNELHGELLNLPLRGVTGHAWSGIETNFAQAPDEYAAIHFHDDDLEDARWDPDVQFDIPDDWPSGVYALEVRCDDGEDRIPFFVRPTIGAARAAIAFLAPTLSYLAYANEHNSWANPIPATPKLDEILDAVGPNDRFAAENRLLSIYELHSDGSGTPYSSRLRPIVNMRDDYAMPLLRGGPHQFPADMELVGWLESLGEHYDVITDEDLHRDGAALLEPYRVVLTGSHPEYWTAAMLEALEYYLAAGGRLMYLGGNGFYWVTSLFSEKPHVLEVRRGQAGTRVWQSEPGENYHVSTGELGGLWRHRGKPPQRLVGVGFTAQGFDESRPYRRGSDADDRRARFAFEGVIEDEIGAYGSVLGGAAGFEIDRVDVALGTPPHALTLATASGFSDAYQGVVEEILTADSQQGGSVSPDVHADVVLFETMNGGAVFSVGSIAWCGALAHGDGCNDVARLTENVLRHFLDPEPLAATVRAGAQDAEVPTPPRAPETDGATRR